jgi:putative transposase
LRRTELDCYSRESLAIQVSQSLKGEDVVRVIEQIAAKRGLPATIRTDNGSEFIGKAMDKWAYEKSAVDFSRPGKPTDNAMVESFNGRLRQECLNEHWFMSLADAQAKIEAWRRAYNESRPHGALDWLTPAEFALRSGASARYGASKAGTPNFPAVRDLGQGQRSHSLDWALVRVLSTQCIQGIQQILL